jgi:hypothetical protein
VEVFPLYHPDEDMQEASNNTVLPSRVADPHSFHPDPDPVS